MDAIGILRLSGAGASTALALCAFLPAVAAAQVTAVKRVAAPVRITVVYDNVPHAPALATAWGFAALVESGGRRVLFDTGGDGPTLLANLRALGVEAIDAVVLSHIHDDHTGGLDDLLAHRSGLDVFVPRSFPAAFLAAAAGAGARVETVSEPRRLLASFSSTGELGGTIREQALVVDAAEGLVVVTGCAHPGIVEVVEAAKAAFGRDVALLMGGFHLRGRSAAANRATVEALKALGVRRVAPSHCTGDEATALFREAWGDGFLRGGCGAVIEID